MRYRAEYRACGSPLVFAGAFIVQLALMFFIHVGIFGGWPAAWAVGEVWFAALVSTVGVYLVRGRFDEAARMMRRARQPAGDARGGYVVSA